MNSKRVNWLFLVMILVEFIVSGLIIVLSLAGVRLNIDMASNLILSEMVLMTPALIFLSASMKGRGARGLNAMLGFHRLKISSLLMIVLFTFLIMPMTTAINAISMIFVDNAVNAVSGDILGMPFFLMLFLMGIFGPFCEEFIFRGVIFTGYKNSGPVFWAVFWSALLFGLMHLNFNQAAYAFAIGIMFALLVEATGSLWSSALAHMIFNSLQVCLMYFVEYIMPGTYSESNAENMLGNDELIAVIGPYLIAGVVGTALAFCVLVWLARNEGREAAFHNIWAMRKKRGAYMVSVPLIIAVVLCLSYMSLELILQ